MALDQTLLSDASIFRFLDDAERLTLAGLFDERAHSPADVIFHRGEPGNDLFLVANGRVEVFVTNDTGDRIVLTEATRGHVFGEISLMDGGPRTASAAAVEDTTLLALDREKLLRLVQLHPHVALDLLRVMGERLRGTDELLRTGAARNLNEEVEEKMGFGERIADRVATFGGSWMFIGIFSSFLVMWIILNSLVLARRPIDPFPYILLNLFLSMTAAFQAPVIMMSQNRQSLKDRLKADLDYQVNLRAELEVAELHRKMDHLTERFELATAKGRLRD